MGPDLHDHDDFVCPKCGGNRAETSAWQDLGNVFWIIFPALVFNEIILGQRLPKRIYLCIRCDEAATMRQYVKCPHCMKFHHGLCWAKGNAFGHWFGLFCPDCGGRIPALMNLFSILVAAATAPLWYPGWLLFGKRWINWEKERTQRARRRIGHRRLLPKNWIAWGILGFGLPLTAINIVYEFLNDPAFQFAWGRAARDIFISIFSGALFGIFMKRVLLRRTTGRPGHCRSCGYELRGLTSGICPECGFEFDPKDQIAETSGR